MTPEVYGSIAGLETKDLPLEVIVCENRFRENLGDLEEMIHSFKKTGLLQGIGVEPIDGGKYRLVYGGRRFAAAQIYCERHKQPPVISCRIFDQPLDDYTYRLIESYENLHRKRMEPYEAIKLEAELHRLFQQKYGTGGPHTPGHTSADTAKFLGKSPSSIRERSGLYEKIEALPEKLQEAAKKARTVKELEDMVKKAQKDFERSDNIIKARAEIGKGNKEKKIKANAYLVGDFFDLVETVQDGSMNFVELDPPYAVDLIKTRTDHRSAGLDSDAFYNEVDQKDYVDFMDRVIEVCYRKLAPNSFMIIWHGSEWISLLTGLSPTVAKQIKDSSKSLSLDNKNLIDGLLNKHGFKFSRRPGIWTKDGAGQTTNTQLNLGSNYEPFVIAYKGFPNLQKPGRENVFHYPKVPSQKKVHPTERPIELMKELLRVFAKPNDKVLVPFAGSGKTLIAAFECDMKPIGFDLSKQYKDSYILMLNGGEVL